MDLSGPWTISCECFLQVILPGLVPNLLVGFVEVNVTGCKGTRHGGFQVVGATVRIKSHGGSVKYQTCLIFCPPRTSSPESITNPN